MKPLPNCHDCGAKPGETHMPGCDTERCSVCGGQKIGCHCEGHDPYFARWTGLWPGEAEAMALDLWCKWTDHGWETVTKDDPEARPDLNRFYALGQQKYFHVKPTEDKGTTRYEEKRKEREP